MKERPSASGVIPFTVFLLSLVGILLGFWDKIKSDQSLAIILISLTLFMLTERLSALMSAREEAKIRRDMREALEEALFRQENALSKGIDRLQQDLKASNIVFALLRPTEVFDRLDGSKGRLKIVKDTIFRHDGDRTYAKDTETRQRSHEWFRKAIDCRCSWYDLLTPNVVSARDEHISYGKANEQFNGQYRCRALDINAPMINFFIVDYEDHPREVYFGWDYDLRPNGIILASQDPRVVDYFDRLFDTLFGLARDVGSEEDAKPQVVA